MRRITYAALAIALLGAGAAGQEREPVEIHVQIGLTKKVRMSKNQVIVEVRNEAPKVCRVQPVADDPTTILVTGIARGRSRLTFLDNMNRMETMDIVVGTEPVVPLLPGHFEISLVDGSIVRMAPQVEKLQIEMKSGRLPVAFKDIRSIDVGLRYPAGVEERIARAVKSLSDDDPRERDQGGRALISLGPWSYSAALQASKSADEDVAGRAKGVMEELHERHPSYDLTRPEEDRVVTSDLVITGRILLSTLRVKSDALGIVELPLARVRSLRAGSEIGNVRKK